ncbi:hypothetical protein UT300009_34720 [Paraclostridium bifermentans]
MKNSSSQQFKLTTFWGCIIFGAVSFIIGGVVTYRTLVGDDFLGLIGAIIGVLGAYGGFCLGVSREKQKEELKEKKELEHKKMMLYTMLEFSVMQSRVSYIEFKKYYREQYNQDRNMINSEIERKFELTGDFIEDFGIMLRVYPCKETRVFDDFIERISNVLFDKMNEYQIAKKVVYIENWYEYIDCIPEINDQNTVLVWIGIIKNSDISINPYQFIANRSVIKAIVDKNYPKVAKMRHEMERQGTDS